MMRLSSGESLRSVSEATPALTVGRIADEELVAAILKKDRKAASEFVERYGDVVYAYLRGRLAPRGDMVDDVAQDVFVAALGSLGRYAGQSSLKTWLLGIARHKVEDYYRARLRQMDSLSEAADDVPDVSTHLEYDASLDRERAVEKTQRILAQLPEQYSVVLLWRYWERRSAREMADETGKTEKAIERLLARARSRFKRLWEVG